MRKLLAVAFSLALAVPMARAQRGGGHGGFASGHGSGFAFGGRGFSSGSMRGPGRSPGQFVYSPGRSVFTPGQFSSASPRVLTPFSRGYGGGYGARPGYGRRYGYGNRGAYFGGGGYWLNPYELGYPDFAGYDDSGYGSSGYDNSGQGAANSGYAAGAGYGAGYGPTSGNPGADQGGPAQYRADYDHAPADAPNVVERQQPALTVVLKNGETEQMRNYALSARTLTDLDDAATGRQQRIPLDQVDLAATENAAAQAGLTFSVPRS